MSKAQEFILFWMIALPVSSVLSLMGFLAFFNWLLTWA